GQLRELGGREPDALEAFGYDTMRGREKADKQVHWCNVRPLVVAGAVVCLAQQADHVVREKFPIQQQQRVDLAHFLMKKFLKLFEQLGQIRAESVAPIPDARVGNGEQSHEDVWASEVVPARLARQ